MSKFDKIKDRVVALLAKASDPAATPDEAGAAMMFAKKLMEKHGMSEADCRKAEGDDFVTRSWAAKASPKYGKFFHPVDKLLSATVAKFAGAKYWYVTDAHGQKSEAEFFGLEGDVALAEWLRAALVKQFDRDWETYVYLARRNTSLKTVPQSRIAFSQGFSTAIMERLTGWLKEEMAAAGDGTALVVIKQDLIDAELGRRGIAIRSAASKSMPSVTDTAAAGAGYVSGKAAAMSQGVGNNRPQILLGGA